MLQYIAIATSIACLVLAALPMASCTPTGQPTTASADAQWTDIHHIQPDARTVERDANAAFKALHKQLNVRTKQHLIFCSPTPEGIAAADAFLQQFPDSDHRETVMYLAAIARWNSYRYAEAANAYRAFLDTYADKTLASLSRTRLIQSLIRSDQTDAAIAAVDAFAELPGADRRELLRADALALAGRGPEAAALLRSWITLDFADGNPRELEVVRQQLARIELIGAPLPTFDVTAYGTGETLSPESLRGHVLLIDFWASWCRPCMAQMPHLVELYKRLHKPDGGGLQILGVSLDDDAARMTKAQGMLGATWPQFFDGKKWKNALAVQFDVHRIPSMLLVDRNGIVRAVDPPPAAIDRLVAEMLREPATVSDQ